MAIRHNDAFSNEISKLFNSDVFSDVVLVVDQKRYYAHKAILVSRSEYFRTLFSSGLSESKQGEIEIQEVNTALFEKLLQYIYAGEIAFDIEAETEGVDLLVMANKYLFKDLELDVAEHLKNILKPQNFAMIYSAACLCSIQFLKEACLKFSDSKSNELLNFTGFSNLEVDAVEEILSRPRFRPEHTVLFTAVSKWIEVNGREDAGPLLSRIRLSDLPLRFLVKTVRPSKLFSDTDIVDAINGMEDLLTWSTQYNAMKIFVDTECRWRCKFQSYMTLEVKSSDTVAAVKEKIRSRVGCCTKVIDSGMDLVCKGTVLQDDRSLKEQNIESGSSIQMSHHYS